jgi:pimeloyl-ACP methyl ester carboxylesterase
MTHLELDAEGPIWRHWIEAFSRTRRLVRYDQRGNGLSDLDAEFSEAAFVEDVEAVVAAAGLDRFDLLGISHGASVAVAYAARHPERVRRLVLLGGFPVGWSKLGNAEEAARREAMITLTAQGWERDNPALRQLFTSLFLPDSIPDEQHWFAEVQRKATPVANACAIQRGTGKTDVRELLPHVRVPTLVAHARNDAMVSFAAGRALAAAIPGARFLALEGSNHVLVSGEPAWARFRDAALAFLDEPL